MIRKLFYPASIVGIILIACSLAFAKDVLLPARQLDSGAGSITVSHSMENEELTLDVKRSGNIRIGAATIASNATNEVTVTGKAQMTSVTWMVRPGEGWDYWLTAGMGTYDLEVPSVTITNTLSGYTKGMRLGMGTRILLIPDTIVTPAVACEAGMVYQSFDLQRLSQTGMGVQAIQNVLDITEIFVSGVISKKMTHLEPYAGLKVSRKHAVLIDTVVAAKVSGMKNTASVMIGSRIPVRGKEALLLEARISEKTTFVVGWNIAF